MAVLMEELDSRGLECRGCAEKADFVRMARENWDLPRIKTHKKKQAEPKKAEAKPKLSEKDVPDVSEILRKFREMGVNAHTLDASTFTEYAKHAAADIQASKTKTKVNENEEVVEAHDEL
jgi:hypothetical protein